MYVYSQYADTTKMTAIHHDRRSKVSNILRNGFHVQDIEVFLKTSVGDVFIHANQLLRVTTTYWKHLLFNVRCGCKLFTLVTMVLRVEAKWFAGDWC